jgi:hypothetical protein
MNPQRALTDDTAATRRETLLTRLRAKLKKPNKARRGGNYTAHT